MLLRPNGAPFATGRSRFLDSQPGSEEASAKIYVRVEADALGMPILAQLDTGSAWSILETEIAEALAILNRKGEPVQILTRFGPIVGHLERLAMTVLADEGESLGINATVFVSRDWPAGTFIGYNGLLERVRFAVDPADNLFYFGAVDVD